MRLYFLAFLLVSSGFSIKTSGQPLGNVKLQCPGNPSLLNTGGYVTVYQPAVQQYVPVCRPGFNRAAAAAVCRQLGYVDAMPAFSGGSYVGDPSDVGLKCSIGAFQTTTSHIKCPNVNNYMEDGELHVMRCSVGPMRKNMSCPITAVQCSSLQLPVSSVYSYIGQVYLIGTADQVYRGLLRVRLSDKFYAVCVDNFNMQAAISVCRQLGYTNGTYDVATASTDPTAAPTSLSSNLYMDSFPCFPHCINNGYSLTLGCSQVFIDCDFQVNDMAIHSAGNRDSCMQVYTDQSDSSGETTGGLSYFTVIIAIIFFLSVTVACAYLYKRRVRHN